MILPIERRNLSGSNGRMARRISPLKMITARGFAQPTYNEGRQHRLVSWKR
ncbi:MAG: hypothetical protein GPOALKHO_001568 [Sodalis sp.]|nr:MAG: hypothetical protein GPOALKHO_001568 [Sodalis sp.]